MATDEHQIERHLTPNGWITGSEWVNGAQTKKVEPPKDRIETWVEEISDSSEGWAPPTAFSKMVWEATNVPAQVRAELTERFPRPEYKPWKQIRRKRRKLADCY
jgi:hypothetical protein